LNRPNTALGVASRVSGEVWYLKKADECTRLAKDAADPHTRAHYETEARLWREIAADIAKKERNIFGSK
jgi:hypothetical protein